MKVSSSTGDGARPGEPSNPKEFRGWWLMHLARQPTVINGAFVGVAIITCAALDSFQTQDGNPISSCKESLLKNDSDRCLQWSVCGCDWKKDSDTQNGTYPGQCGGDWERSYEYLNATAGNTTYSCAVALASGIVPSSLLVILAGIANAVILATAPIVGTVFDATDFRKPLWAVGMAFLTLYTYSLVILGSGGIWVGALVVAILAAITSEYTIIAHLSYLPELGDKVVQAKASGTGITVGFLAQLALAIIVAVIGTVFKFEDVATATLSSCIAGTNLLVVSPISLWHMSPRPAKHALKGSYVGGTFKSLWRLAKLVRKDYTQAFIFLCSHCFGSAGASGIVAIAGTYFVSEVKLNAIGYGLVVAIVLIVGAPAALVGSRLLPRFGLRRTLLGVYAVWTVVGIVTPIVLYNQNHKIGAYILAGIYGILLATFYTAEPALFASLIPPSFEAEFMGLYIFFAYLLRWLPLLIYGACDNINMPRLGLGIFGSIFFAIAGTILFFVDTTKADVQRSAKVDDEEPTYTPTAAPPGDEGIELTNPAALSNGK